MVLIATWVAQLPGAVGRMPAFGTGPLLLATAGMLLLCLLKTPLRWSGAAVAAIAAVGAMRAPQPDILVADGARAFAARTAQGQLAILNLGKDAFTVREWLAADGDGRSPGDDALSKGWTCDAAGCLARLHGGSTVAVVLLPDAFEEDCRRAAIVLTSRQAPPGCKAHVIDRNVWTRTGALALTSTSAGIDTVVVRPPNWERPWLRMPPDPSARAPRRTAPPVPPDATPRIEDLAVGD
jgi:competence protein ComEC